jgi:hypothetical protein
LGISGIGIFNIAKNESKTKDVILPLKDQKHKMNFGDILKTHKIYNN